MSQSEERFVPDIVWEGLKSLLIEVDFDHISVKKICQISGIHRATFYRYFPDVFELLNYGLKSELTTDLDRIFLSDGSFESFELFLFKLDTLKQHIRHLKGSKYFELILTIFWNVIHKQTVNNFDKDVLSKNKYIVHFYSTGMLGLIELYFIDHSIKSDELAKDMTTLYQQARQNFKTNLRQN